MQISNEIILALKKHKAVLVTNFWFGNVVRISIEINGSGQVIEIPMEKIVFANFDIIGHNIEGLCKELKII